ncbi:hypothetical protein A2807_02450 [Candidatus Berkelbacteria bacterium RIFCSPHIGHO2_01_FULL_50_36]|nr:MAG: hypothetical protein A2807_02450 [Candidatus Berkelbacteria bacterium RIFCSPHIGHO2_01_FULL_50_36]OGD62661.1 MAG: hypothetical protein A3F39_00465 [Candidatus Berkelbacteria bacterium RIFCSPHIGHO2_12_FULL_50_11]
MSVGAVVVNDEGLIACRHHQHDEHNRPVDAFLLMRETIEPGETIENAVARGLKEEFGLVAKITQFLGPVVSHYGYKNFTVEKTTLFFLCRFTKLVELKENDFESSGNLEWHDLDLLIEKQHAQAKHLSRDDIDDSLALKRAKEILG